MPQLDKDVLRKLGDGESVANICSFLKIGREEFDRRWRETIARRAQRSAGNRTAPVAKNVNIVRDRWGIPHIFAQNNSDLWFGFGFAIAQDRLFQLDYLRRKGHGRLSEVLGTSGMTMDLTARTIGLHRIAAAEWNTLSPEVRELVQRFSDGINAHMSSLTDNLPIEFDLLDYRPEKWSPVDCLAIESEFRWYLTGRFPVIVIPELAKRTLGGGRLYEEFILGEADDEPILHSGDYKPRGRDSTVRTDCIGQVLGGAGESVGSNNWVISGKRTSSGLPLVASDPHIAFEAVSCWYEAHLVGGDFNVAGMSYVGIPAIMFGRNERVAWGITNNICSLRDLYQERVDPTKHDHFLFDGKWERETQRPEVIQVRGSQPVTKVIRSSRNGPIVDELLPPAATNLGPVSIKWLGSYQGGWLSSLLGMDRAKNVDELREAVRPWHVPTFSLVFADDSGKIGYHAAGRIPQRRQGERGFRPGWDPQHEWLGVTPFESMPSLSNPDRGWIATANNRVAAEDFPIPMFGCWASGWRALRIRQMIESRDRLSVKDISEMHQDAKSLRAEAVLPSLLATLAKSSDPRVQSAQKFLAHWNCVMEPSSVAATIFDVFFVEWSRTVAAERFDSSIVELMSGGVGGCAVRLLSGDDVGWFTRSDRESGVVGSLLRALDYLEARLGPDDSQWQWERLHRMPLKHVLSSRGSLGELLDHGGAGVRGDYVTVCNTGNTPDFTAASGAGYRLIADLSTSPPKLFAVDGQSQSGHPGSPNYSDQFKDWVEGRYHEIPLCREASQIESSDRTVLSAGT